MPDIQTEMKKVMQAWEQPYPITQPIQEPEMTNTTPRPTAFVKSTGVTEATFNIVRDQPGLPTKDYVRMLSAQGYKKASTTSILSQLIKQGQLWADSTGFLRPNQKAYTPLKGHYKRKGHKKVAVAKPVETFKVKTSKPATKYKTKDVPVPAGIAALVEERKTRDEVQHIMDTISLPDAKRLHKALNEYFGSV